MNQKAQTFLRILITLILFVANDVRAQNKCQQLFVIGKTKPVATSRAEYRYAEIQSFFLKLIKDEQQVNFLDQILWGFKYEVSRAEGDLQKAGFMINEKTFRVSEKKPVPIWTESGTLGKSLILWRGQLFVEGHFRNMAFSPEFRSDKHAAVEKTIRYQLWGEWSHERKEFVFRVERAQNALLTHFYNSKKLYRGMRDFEFKILQALAHLYKSDFALKKELVTENIKFYLSKTKLAEADRQHLEKLLQTIEKSSGLSREESGMIADAILTVIYNDQSVNRVLPLFTSPNVKIGKKWANPDIAEFSLTQNDLKQLSDKNEIFVGVEDIDLEIGFFSVRSWKVLIHSMTVL